MSFFFLIDIWDNFVHAQMSQMKFYILILCFTRNGTNNFDLTKGILLYDNFFTLLYKTIHLHNSQTLHYRSSASRLNTHLLMIQPPLHIRAIPPKFNFHPKSLAASLINIKPWAYDTIFEAYKACKTKDM